MGMQTQAGLRVIIEEEVRFAHQVPSINNLLIPFMNEKKGKWALSFFLWEIQGILLYQAHELLLIYVHRDINAIQ